MKKILKSEGFQSFIASLICILLGLFIGYIVLLFINAKGAGEAIFDIIKNFLTYSKASSQIKYLGNTLVKTVPLLLCSLSIIFAYKAGLFNIGVAGQYTIGICASLYPALAWHWSFLPCMLFAIVVSAIWGSIVGIFKAYFNVNEVIAGIMLNWIGLYITNMVLSIVKEPTSPYTFSLSTNKSALLPSLGLGKLFSGNQYVGLALILGVILSIVIYIILEKTKFGYELKATGFNANAAKYSGMAQNKNIILTLAIAGALAGLGASLFYLTGYEQYAVTSSSVPGMGFNGIAAAFLGGLNPIGSIFSSFFIQHISSGGAYVDKTMYCAQISDLISSIIIYLCGFVGFIRLVLKSLGKEKEVSKVTGEVIQEKGGKK